jgi:transposase
VLSWGGRPIWLYRGWVDMRCQVDRLAQLVEHQLQRDPYTGDVFVFLGRDRRRVKLLMWDTSGFWLATKRLECGLYASPVVLEGPSSCAVLALSSAEMGLILEGISVHRATYASHYRRTDKIDVNTV